MKKANHIESSCLFRQAVLFALKEQQEIDPAPLRDILLHLSGDALQSDVEKIGWLRGEITLKIFYNSHIKHEFITCDYGLFKIHFTGTEHILAKIKWNSNLNELVYLFTRLREEKIIPLHKTPHVLLQENFIDKYENPIKAGSLRTLLEKGIRNTDRVEMIDNIIDDVLSYKSI
jgi:hypothetical protein